MVDSGAFRWDSCWAEVLVVQKGYRWAGHWVDRKAGQKVARSVANLAVLRAAKWGRPPADSLGGSWAARLAGLSDLPAAVLMAAWRAARTAVWTDGMTAVLSAKHLAD